MLIIGILAAVAVPQYQKAVIKARATEAIGNLYELRKAQQVYFLASGKYTKNLEELDLSFTNGFYNYFCIAEDLIDCYASRADGKKPNFEITDNFLLCRGNESQCKPISVQNTGWESGDYWIVSPN